MDVVSIFGGCINFPCYAHFPTQFSEFGHTAPESPILPWHESSRASIFTLEVDPDGRRDPSSPDLRRRTAEKRLANLPEEATWIWTDGSAEGGIREERGGPVIMLPDGDTREVRVRTSSLCSSTRADLFALKVALEELASIEDRDTSQPVVICTDSRAALTRYRAALPHGEHPWRRTSGAC